MGSQVLPISPVTSNNERLVDPASLTGTVRLASAVLLFHRGGPWTPQDHAAWLALTGSPLATTRTLCDLARRTISEETT